VIETHEDYEQIGKLACGNNFAYIYFLSFMIFVAFMLMNLFIAIIIESYELRVKIEKTRVPAVAFVEFMRKWQ
jgi:hypothetical protein